MRSSKRSWSDDLLIQAVKTSNTLMEVSGKLGLGTYGANSRTIKKRILLLKIDTSHFGVKMNKKKVLALTYNELFCINNVCRQYIKKIIIKEHLIPYKCDLCSIIDIWEDKPLSLHLDHINGINNDNRLSNLRFLCPNCHSQTSTYCGRKLKIIRNEKYCTNCNSSISLNSKTNLCRLCASLNRSTKIDWVDTTLLIEMVEELGYEEVGRRLGVSGNAVKKRIRKHPKYEHS